jgi:membrane-bound lytic murein transglycosylase D
MNSRIIAAFVIGVFLALLPNALQAKTPPADSPANGPSDNPSIDPQQVYEAGKELFDQFAPDDIKRDYEFPSQQDWDAFVARVQEALQGGSLEELAALEPDVRRALIALKLAPEYSEYNDWLAGRLDLIETARDAVEAQKRPPATRNSPPLPGPTSPPTATAVATASLPYYDVWLQRLHDRPKPAQADDLIPLLKVIFSAEGLPPELAWLAEVESSLNPAASSPAGARGLFQLMPATAKSLGLSLFPFDERVQPGKNARAAAKMLRRLHDRFEDWPLALAAYNAGEGKLAALLKKDQANTFASVANDLPVETRMYVPKVFATMAVREHLAPGKLLGPVRHVERKPDFTPEPAKSVQGDAFDQTPSGGPLVKSAGRLA